jgi:hypothetical protein
MGVLYGYYSAADDKDAARAVAREFGEADGSGHDQHVTIVPPLRHGPAAAASSSTALWRVQPGPDP